MSVYSAVVAFSHLRSCDSSAVTVGQALDGNLISLICSLSADGSGLPQCWGGGTTGVSYVCLTYPVADVGWVIIANLGSPHGYFGNGVCRLTGMPVSLTGRLTACWQHDRKASIQDDTTP